MLVLLKVVFIRTFHYLIEIYTKNTRDFSNSPIRSRYDRVLYHLFGERLSVRSDGIDVSRCTLGECKGQARENVKKREERETGKETRPKREICGIVDVETRRGAL